MACPLPQESCEMHSSTERGCAEETLVGGCNDCYSGVALFETPLAASSVQPDKSQDIHECRWKRCWTRGSSEWRTMWRAAG